MKDFNATMSGADEQYHTSQSNLAAGGTLSAQQTSGAHSRPQSQIADEMAHDLTYLSREAPLDGGESTFGGAYSQLGLDQAGAGEQRPMSRAELLALSQENGATNSEAGAGDSSLLLEQLAPDNVDIERRSQPPQQAG